MAKETIHLPDDPQWYKDAIIYELHVKSFHDSNADGIGDFKGLTQKLDYLQTLGITAVWLLPFYPSPQRDDGYDIADYYHVNPQYGTMRDFRIFLKEAHDRGIRVITELVINHTSDQHAWFRKSRRAKPGSTLRDFYVWSDTPEKYKDARIIFTDFETSNWTWDPIAKAYYWHRFYSHQPDLNFDNPAVAKAVQKVLDYWFEMGVDGMRLDAVPYLFEREGTNCENLPETYQFLESLRAHVDRKFKNKLLLAEANQWPEDAVAYFGEGNRCHMAFHFPVMPRLFMASWMEDRFPIVDIFEQTPAIPETCQWALFLRNHDELTLEMVSDEERDYMYRVYARDPTARINLGIRRRLAPLLNNNRRKIELMNILLFSLPGTPVIYYGDEICMGDNHYLGDRNGVRTPMQWSSDRNAGFSRATPQKLFLPVIIDPDYHYEAVSVDSQERNQSSPLWWMRRVIAMRKRFKAFGRGSITFLNCDNPKVLAFTRRFENEVILVVVNLSRFSQVAELEISEFAGYTPEEVVSGNKFPQIKEAPYVLTLGFHDYYWFSLQKQEQSTEVTAESSIPDVTVIGRWQSVFDGKAGERLERNVLPKYIKPRRWFGGKARVIQQVKIVESIPIGTDSTASEIVLLDIRYTEGANEMYMLPVSFATHDALDKVKETPQALICQLKTGNAEGMLFDGAYNPQLRSSLLAMVARRQTIKGENGHLVAYAGQLLKRRRRSDIPLADSHVIKAEQSNTSIIYGNELFLKLFRRLDEGINPDLEIGRFLTEQAGFVNTPGFAGGIEYRRPGMEPIVLAILQKFIPNAGDAWSFTLNFTRSYFEAILSRADKVAGMPAARPLLDMAAQEVPLAMVELIGGVYLEMVALLGTRTAEMHLALATPTDDPKFVAEAFTVLYQRSLYHSMRTLAKRVFETLRKNSKTLEPPLREKIENVLKLEKDVLLRFSTLFSRKIAAMKTRIHGDYHLGQVLYGGNDFFIIDFEGEPARSVSERRLKRSPMRDVAGMIRSFHYPTYATLFTDKSLPQDKIQELGRWADLWYAYVAGTFLKAYLKRVGNAPFVPKEKAELKMMLDAYLLEKAIYEVGYELNNRPDWLIIPLQGMTFLMEKES